MGGDQLGLFLEARLEQVSFTPTEFAKLAPLIVQHAKDNDQHALTIVKSGAEYLSQLATKLLEGRDVHLALIGGLSPLIERYLTPNVVSTLRPAKQPPEIGAVLFAKKSSTEQMN